MKSTNEDLVRDAQAMGIRALIDLETKPLIERAERAEKILKDFSEAPWRAAIEGICIWGPDVLAAGDASEALRLVYMKGRVDMGMELRKILSSATDKLYSEIGQAERNVIRFGGKP